MNAAYEKAKAKSKTKSSTVKAKKAPASALPATTETAASGDDRCYTKSGDSSTVSIWSGGFKVGETSEDDAKASGIPPCGG
jgi:hypothetical protein